MDCLHKKLGCDFLHIFSFQCFVIIPFIIYDKKVFQFFLLKKKQEALQEYVILLLSSDGIKEKHTSVLVNGLHPLLIISVSCSICLLM